MNDLKSWLDDDGFLHTDFNPAVDQSENSPMFTGLLTCFKTDTISLNSQVSIWGRISGVNDLFRANSNREFGSHFSHDNMTGLYCMRRNCFGGNYRERKLPTVKWNNRWWLHPRDLAFYFWVHHPILGFPFLWIASLTMIISCAQNYKVRNGRKIIKTDGKLLAYMRCKSFDMHITFAICSFFIRRHTFFNNWNDVAKMYFKVKGHPLRSLIK